MTQAHLALAAGVSERTVIRAERGHAINCESLRSLCGVLGIDATTVGTTPNTSLAATVEAFGETAVWVAPADVATWRARNAFGAWGILAGIVGGANAANVALCACASVGMVEVDDDIRPAFVVLLASSVACQAWLVGRVRAYVKAHRRLRHVTYAISDKATYVISDKATYVESAGNDGCRSTTRYEGLTREVAGTDA